SRVFEHLEWARGVKVCVGITGIQAEIRRREVVAYLVVGDPSCCRKWQTELPAAFHDWVKEIASPDDKKNDIRRLPGRQRQSVNEKERAAARQADEAHHLFPLEPEFCPGAIALTAGDPAHAHAVWNVDSVFPEPLQAVDKYAGCAQNHVTVRDVLRLDVLIRDEIQTIENLGNGQIKWRQTHGFVAKAINEHINAQIAYKLSGIETEELFIGPEASCGVFSKAPHHMAAHIRNTWPAVNRYAPLPEGGPTER